MRFFLYSRYRILSAVIVCYLLPLLTLIFITSLYAPVSTLWLAMSIGLLISAGGALFLFLLISTWEFEIQSQNLDLPPQPQLPIAALNSQLVAEAEARAQAALGELDRLRSDFEETQQSYQISQNDYLVLTKENERLQRQVEQTRREFEQFKISTEEKLEQNHLFLGEYQQTINEQRCGMESKQQVIEQLETKVRDLTYEIKTLLQLAEKVQNDRPQTIVPLPTSGHTLCDSVAPYHVDECMPANATQSGPDKSRSSVTGASSQLKRCLDIAQKITGGSHYANRSSKARELSFDNNALDLRRLCDSLGSEATSALWVYSQKENKLLFVNQEIKNLLGWHPEKFIQNFTEILGINSAEWSNMLAQLEYKNECQAQLPLKAKGGQFVSLHCHMGVILTGMFRGHVIGIVNS